MSRHEETPLHADQERKNSKWVHLCEIVFGGIAKATMVLVAIVFLLLSFPEGLTTLPTTRKDLLIFILICVIGAIGSVGIFFLFQHIHI